mmetsp:Transcript_23218/g.65928  ORF Transcript_23218/g.65928 Transcript_23218/m.65928 type:complete len:270 (+) Transcript_23218:614-1423(+)
MGPGGQHSGASVAALSTHPGPEHEHGAFEGPRRARGPAQVPPPALAADGGDAAAHLRHGGGLAGEHPRAAGRAGGAERAHGDLHLHARLAAAAGAELPGPRPGPGARPRGLRRGGPRGGRGRREQGRGRLAGASGSRPAAGRLAALAGSVCAPHRGLPAHDQLGGQDEPSQGTLHPGDLLLHQPEPGEVVRRFPFRRSGPEARGPALVPRHSAALHGLLPAPVRHAGHVAPVRGHLPGGLGLGLHVPRARLHRGRDLRHGPHCLQLHDL